MTAHQTNAYLLQAREAGIAETPDPGASRTIRPGRRDRSYCVLTAGAGATSRVLSDPDDHPLDQEITLIAVGITGANTITITGLQGSTPTYVFSASGMAIFRLSLEDSTKVWVRVAPGTVSSANIEGDVGAVDNAIVRVDGTTGDTIQGSPLLISDAGWLSPDGGDGGVTVDANDVVYVKSESGEPALIILNANGVDGGFHFNQSGAGSQATGNLFFGYLTGTAISSGTLNVGIGIRVAELLTTGGSNVAIGSQALRDNANGSNNVAIGTNALRDGTTISGHVAIGNGVMVSGSGGSANTGIGQNALAVGGGTSSNLALGTNTLQLLTSGNSNVAIGASALSGVNGASFNVGIGFSAGLFITTGGANTLIGAGAGSLITTGSNNICIGGVQVPVGTASNQLNIGDLIISPDMTTGVVEIRRGTTPACLFVYNTFTSTTNYERVTLDWVGNVARVQTQKGAGGGTARALELGTDGTTRITIGATGGVTFQGGVVVATTGAITFPDDIRQTFNPGATNAGLNVGSIAGDPSSPSNGDLWYDSTANELTARINGANVALGAGGGGEVAHIVQARLTTESGVPVSTSDRTAQSTIYFTPYNGNSVRIYDGSEWVLYSLTEISLALSGLTSDKNYDVFVYDNAGTLTLELSAAWTNDTTRNDALALQDGVYVKSGATTRLWIGTIRTTGTTTTEDSGGGSTTQVGGKRFVWNAYNQVPRHMTVIDTTDSWSYTTASWRQANGASGNQVAYVTGRADSHIEVDVTCCWQGGGNSNVATIAVGLSSTTAPSGVRSAGFGLASEAYGISAVYRGYPGLGYNFLAWIEFGGGGGTSVFQGDSNGATQAGLSAVVLG